MPLTPTTELEAVNEILSIIGETPVNSLDVPSLTDAAIARDNLRAVSREVQSRGWYFNTDEQYRALPAADGLFVLPANLLAARPATTETRRIVPREGKLYDRDASSFVFTAAKPPIIYAIWQQEFESLPETARRCILIRAARLYQTKVMGSDKLDALTEAHEAQAFQALLDEHASYQEAATFEAGATQTKELEAVNEILASLGRPVVPSFASTGLTDANLVRAALRSQSREVQSQGWYFNTDESWRAPIDEDGIATIPTDTLAIRPARGEARRIVPRRGRLFDRDAHSDVFTSATRPMVERVTFETFESLPETARRLITLRAGLVFQDSLVSRGASQESEAPPRPYSAERVAEALNVLQAAHDEFHAPAGFNETLTTSVELESVNELLDAIGEEPVEVLPTKGYTPAMRARTLLKAASREVQSEGWYFNTVQFEADTAAEPDWLLARTDEKTGYLNVFLFLPYDTLPAPAQRLITARAGLVFQRLNAASMPASRHDTLPFNETRLYEAVVAMRRAEAEYNPANFLTDSEDVRTAWETT